MLLVQNGFQIILLYILLLINYIDPFKFAFFILFFLFIIFNFNSIFKKVKLHSLGTLESNDPIIYQDRNDKFFLSVARTKNHKYVLINSNSKESSEVIFFEIKNWLKLKLN